MKSVRNDCYLGKNSLLIDLRAELVFIGYLCYELAMSHSHMYCTHNITP